MKKISLVTSIGVVPVRVSNSLPDDLFEWDNGELCQMPVDRKDFIAAVKIGLAKRVGGGSNTDNHPVRVSLATYKTLLNSAGFPPSLYERIKSLFN